ncbi:glucosamine inositolphosphorylceramide transferase family protein [Salegentibacter sp. HM20]
MKRILKILLLFGILGIVILMIFNYRYPFFTHSVGNWSVGFTFSPEVFPKPKLSIDNIISYSEIDSLLPEEIDYIADPFFLKDSSAYYIFTEIKGKGNADIAVFRSEDGLSYEYGGIVLDEDFHLSYPQVFKHKNEYFMLPETAGSNNVLLYKAKNFPFDWQISDTLIKDRHLKDPSILLSDDLNLIVAVDDDLKQYMFVSDSLRGSWKEAENYKQRWGNESRPGGRFFKEGENWYLPLQNRSKGYGTGISLYQLKNEEGYLELVKAEHMYLGPQQHIKWFNRGMHHLDIQDIGEDYYMVYDGDRNVSGEKSFQYKRTIKFNLIDLYNYFKN